MSWQTHEQAVAEVMKAAGRLIESMAMREEKICIVFADHSELAFYDGGQDCCENRYTTTDDDLQSFTGARFVGLDVLEAPEPSSIGGSSDGEHEIQFVHVRTSAGTATFQTHNEHNGYYGGFSMQATFTESFA